MVIYREANDYEAETIARLCADSFADYPLYQVIRDDLGSDEAYRRFVYELHLLLANIYLRSQLVLVGTIEEEIVSVAMVEDPARKDMGMFSYLTMGGFGMVRCLGFFRLLKYMKILTQTMAAYEQVKAPKWHLAVLAITRNCRGQKLGSGMLQDCLIPRIRQEHGVRLTLTTNTERNSRFYARNGFTQLDKRSVYWNTKKVDNWTFLMEL